VISRSSSLPPDAGKVGQFSCSQVGQFSVLADIRTGSSGQVCAASATPMAGVGKESIAGSTL